MRRADRGMTAEQAMLVTAAGIIAMLVVSMLASRSWTGRSFWELLWQAIFVWEWE